MNWLQRYAQKDFTKILSESLQKAFIENPHPQLGTFSNILSQNEHSVMIANEGQPVSVVLFVYYKPEEPGGVSIQITVKGEVVAKESLTGQYVSLYSVTITDWGRKIVQHVYQLLNEELDFAQTMKINSPLLPKPTPNIIQAQINDAPNKKIYLAKVMPDIVYPNGAMVRGYIWETNGQERFVVTECLTLHAETNLMDVGYATDWDQTQVHEMPYPPGTILDLENVELWGDTEL
jgi:hypothetical protein